VPRPIPEAAIDSVMAHGPEADHGGGDTGGAAPAPQVREAPKVGRNDPCYCGSGRKFKHCHGR